jgi:hypothetical protein
MLLNAGRLPYEMFNNAAKTGCEEAYRNAPQATKVHSPDSIGKSDTVSPSW